MTVKIKKYVATVHRYVEDENTGAISKVEDEIILEGQRFTEAGVWKKIPRDCKLISHGWVEKEYEVDPAALEKFLVENGKLATE